LTFIWTEPTFAHTGTKRRTMSALGARKVGAQEFSVNSARWGDAVLPLVPVTCGCGNVVDDVAPLRKLGWQTLGSGDAAFLVNCDGCNHGVIVAVALDASVCGGCRRLIVGTSDDPKVCVGRGLAGVVLCLGCERRVVEKGGR
jgi:hypothetical protein